MDQAAWLGLAVGSIIGGAYAWFQLRSLYRTDKSRDKESTPGLSGQMAGAGARLLFLATVLVLLVMVPGEKIDKGWLTGSLAVFYGVPLMWRLKKMFAHKQ